jgi:MipA family protein
MHRRALIALASCCLATPALAQSTGAPLPSPEEAGNGFTVALGAGMRPDYVGSDDYHFIPAGGLRGMIGPVGISTRSTYLYADFFPRNASKIDFDVGPIVGVNFNRTGHIEDDLVKLLPDRDTAIEAGAFVGISLHDITNPYDTLSFRLDAKHDIAGAHKSTVVSPNIEFSTPLSRFTYVSFSTGLDFVSDKYARYYYGITPAEALISGLPAFDPDGGMEKWRLGALINQSITGDLTHGISIWGTAEYSHLTGDMKDSPIVSLRGSASQWLVAAGLAYTWR